MTDLDFIPPAIHAAAARRRSARSQIVWGAGMALAMLCWLSVHRVQVSRASDQLDAARAEQQQLSDRRRFYDGLMGERDRLVACEQLQDAVNDRASYVTIMAELAALLPEGALLTEIAADAPLDAPTAAAPVGSPKPATPAVALPPTAHWPRLRLSGAAPSNVLVSTFTARMGGSPLFRDVQTGAVRDGQYAGRTVRQFTVECFIVPQKGGSR